jgi:mannose-6-phosphate isomerase-like protein (cupin superfamily)
MTIQRRSFLKSAASIVPAAALNNVLAQTSQGLTADPVLHPVAAGEDRLGPPHTLGYSSIAFKVLTADTGGNLFVIEHMHLAPGGPPLHLHLEQDEWFYVMEGKMAFFVGGKHLELSPGESVLGPRRVPHAFSSIAAQSRMLIAFTPADKMEQFFLDAEASPKLAFSEDFMNRYDMKWVGPSPFWKS